MRPNKYQRFHKLIKKTPNLKLLKLEDSFKEAIDVFSGSFNFPGVLKYFFGRMLKDFGVSTILVYMYNKSDEEIDLIGYKGIGEDKLVSLKSFEISRENRDILSRTIINRSIQVESEKNISQNLAVLNPYYQVSIPILFQKEILGILVIIKSRITETFSFDPDFFKMHYYLLSLGMKMFNFMDSCETAFFSDAYGTKYDNDLERIIIYQRIIRSMIKEFGFLEFIVNPLEALRKKLRSEDLIRILDGVHYILKDTFGRVRKIEEFTNIKIEETIPEVSLTVFDPVDMIDFELIKRKAQAKRVEVNSNIEKGYFVKAKKDEVKRAFDEIFDNVFQFISHESSLMISTFFDNKYVSISVVNTTDSDVFDIENDSLEPFISKSPWSMGLGFSIAFSLIARNRGKLLFFSQGNQVSTTRIIFPIYAEHKDRDDSKKSILVIDDDRTFVDMMYEILVDRGYRVDTTGNADDAIRKAGSRNYDAIICDLKLPDKDGWWVLNTLYSLKTAEGLQIPQVILTSGYLDELDRSKMLQYGVNYYLTKPFRYIDLINILNRVL